MDFIRTSSVATFICEVLPGAHRNEVVENLVVTLGVELGFESGDPLALRAVDTDCVADDVGRFGSRHGCTISRCASQ